MANLNNESETIAKGLRLTVIVEHSFENIIAVFLLHNGKEYRGALLECDQGFFPHGIPFSNRSMVEQKTGVKSSPRSALDIKPDTENKPPDLFDNKDEKVEQPSSVGRFSYSTNPFLTNPRPVADIPTVEMKPVGLRRKTVRDIRLRPRQTLCSKCKSAIHDSHKGHSVQGNLHHSVADATNNLIAPSKSPLKLVVDVAPTPSPALPAADRKRKAPHQSPMVLLEDIQLKSVKTSSEKISKVVGVSQRPPSRSSSREVTRNKLSDWGGNRKHVRAKSRSNRSSSCGSTNSSTNSVGQDWLQIIDDSESSKGTSSCSKASKKEKGPAVSFCNSKPSPAIKITIGQGAILKIPPRLPEKESQISLDLISLPKVKIVDSCESSEYEMNHKKAKKAAKKAKDRDKSKPSISKVESGAVAKEDEAVPYKNPKKHKKKHRHKHESPEHMAVFHEDIVPQPVPPEEAEVNSYSEPLFIDEGEKNSKCIDADEKSSDGDSENHENALPVIENVSQPRPRLVYTWKQNQGLSRVATSPRDSPPSVSPKYLIKSSPSIIPIGSSPHRRKNASPARVVSASPSWRFAPSPNCMLKDYPLRSKSSTTFSSGLGSESVPAPEYGMVQTSEGSQSHSSGLDSHISDFSDDSGDDSGSEEFFPGSTSPMRDEDDKGIMKPLMMKIQTQNVEGCVLEEGREIRVGDIVWGKIQGFPWWPGRVSNITITQRDNDVIINRLANVAWFGSNTMSHMHCSDLFPFLEDFKARYNKKKKGQYRLAIKQATMAAQMLAAGTHREFSFEDYEL